MSIVQENKVGLPVFAFLTQFPIFILNSLSAKSVLVGKKTHSYVLDFYVGIVHNILRETKTQRAKIYLPTQCTNQGISYDIN